MDCGIYVITSPDGVYIGGSIRIGDRWKLQHQPALRKNLHKNKRLQRAKTKYGLAAIKHKILEYCQASELEQRELYWHQVYKVKGKKLFSRPSRHPVYVDKTLQSQMLSLFISGLSVTEIADLMHYKLDIVSKHLKLCGITVEQIEERRNLLLSVKSSQNQIKLDSSQVAKIRQLRTKGETYASIGERFNVHLDTIRRVVLKRSPYEK